VARRSSERAAVAFEFHGPHLLLQPLLFHLYPSSMMSLDKAAPISSAVLLSY
jgi:hypothetical protein